VTYGEDLETQRRNFATGVLIRQWGEVVRGYNDGNIDPRVVGDVDN
jgi:hypothetical protein